MTETANANGSFRTSQSYNIWRWQAGVEALRRARSDVSRLQGEAAQQELALRDKQAAAAHALQQISATVRANTDHKDEMQTLKRNIELENEKLQAQ